MSVQNSKDKSKDKSVFKQTRVQINKIEDGKQIPSFSLCVTKSHVSFDQCLNTGDLGCMCVVMML